MAQVRRFGDDDEQELFPRLNAVRRMVGAGTVEHELAALGREDILARRRAALRALGHNHPH
jgi:hypothetical protein